jgi:phytoene synthase
MIAAPYQPEDVAAVTALTRAAGTSFYRGMTVLSAPRRVAMYGVYAFCRVVDDIADDDGVSADARIAGLNRWRHRVLALYQGEADEPTTRVLRTAIARHGLEADDFLAIIDGMAMDINAPIVAPDEATLDLYCDRVASAVGRLSIRIFGEPTEAGRRVAYHLGRALQLTNILRDLGEDAQRQRLYLPRELLDADQVPLEPRAALVHPRLPLVLCALADRAAQHFDQAALAMQACDERAMRPARLMAASYRPLLDIMRARAFAAPTQRPSLPLWRKLGLAAQLWLLADRRAEPL